MGNKNAAQTGKEDDYTTVKSSGLVTNNKEQVTSAGTAGTKVVALYQYKPGPQYPDELAFEKDEVLYVDESTLDDDWWEARNAQGRIGYIPSNFVKLKATPSGLVTNNQEQVTPPWIKGTDMVALYKYRSKRPED